MKREIIRLAIPNILANLSVPLLGLADTAVMGHLPSATYLGAVALGGMIFNFIFWSLGFLRMSTTGLTAQAYGRRNEREMALVFGRALLISLLMASLILILQFVIAEVAFGFISTSNEVLVSAKQYYFIRIYAAPATLANYVILGWLLGMQNSRLALVLVVSENVLNIIFNLWFVLGMGMTSDGVALGTVLAQSIGTLIGLAIIAWKYGHVMKLISTRALLHVKSLIALMRVNGDIFIRTISLIAVFTFFTSRSAAESDQTLAANTILLQFFTIFSFFMDGLAFAGESLSGRFLGAGKRLAMNYLLRVLFIWGFVLSVAFSFLYLIGNQYLLQALSSQKDIIDLAQKSVAWVIAVPLVSFVAFLWDGIYIGALKSAAMRNVMLMAAFLVFFPLFTLLNYWNITAALWIAFLSFFMARSVLMSVFWKYQTRDKFINT